MERRNFVGVIEGTHAELAARTGIDSVGYLYQETDHPVVKISDGIHAYSALKAIPVNNLAESADVAAITDNSGGTSGGNTIAVITLPTFAWNGSTDPTAAEATAINAALTSIKNAVATNAAKVNAILTALKAAGLMA